MDVYAWGCDAVSTNGSLTPHMHRPGMGMTWALYTRAAVLSNEVGL